MEVCKFEANSRVPDSLSNNKPLFSSPHPRSNLSFSRQGLDSCKYFPLRSAKSDDTSSAANQFPNAKLEDTNSYAKNVQNETPRDEPPSVMHVHHQPRFDQAYQEEEGSMLDVKNMIAEFADKLNFKFDSEDSYSIALYGSSAAAALYLATAVIGALDSIPLFPKLMEVVGLGYSVWFTNRYLLFKKNRDELAAKIEELKQQVLGSGDE